MSEKEKEAPKEEQKEETPEEVEVETPPEPVEVQGEEEADDNSSSQIDYKAIAEAERARVAKLEQLIAKNKVKAKEEDYDPEDTPLTRSEAQKLIEEGRALNQQIVQESMALELARKHSSSEEEAQAAFLMWKNRVKPTDNLEEDIKFAVGGLNRDRLISANSELRRALQSKGTRSSDAASTHRDAPELPEVKVSQVDAALWKSQGYKWNGSNKRYEKPLNNGKVTLCLDPQTKRTWVEE